MIIYDTEAIVALLQLRLRYGDNVVKNAGNLFEAADGSRWNGPAPEAPRACVIGHLIQLAWPAFGAGLASNIASVEAAVYGRIRERTGRSPTGALELLGGAGVAGVLEGLGRPS